VDLQNKIAVITGVGKGIGYETCLQMLEKGAIVYGLGRNNVINHTNYTFIECDVRYFEKVEHAFKQILVKHDRIDILLNNAGLGYFGMLEDITIDQWDEMYQTNVNGIFHCCKMALPSMKKNQFGHIINIASTAALFKGTSLAGIEFLKGIESLVLLPSKLNSLVLISANSLILIPV
jgi:NAD(P)-dependent dehydrogenase (short-subunit alcohol dehydrogenase family)